MRLIDLDRWKAYISMGRYIVEIVMPTEEIVCPFRSELGSDLLDFTRKDIGPLQHFVFYGSASSDVALSLKDYWITPRDTCRAKLQEDREPNRAVL